MVERRVALLRLLIDEHGMALREGAALDVLARQADREALVEQRGEGQGLGGRPVDAGAFLDHLAAGIEHALRACDGLVKPFGSRGQPGRRARAAWRRRRRSGRGGDRRRWSRRPSCRTSGRRASRPCWPCSRPSRRNRHRGACGTPPSSRRMSSAVSTPSSIRRSAIDLDHGRDARRSACTSAAG